MSRYVFLFFFFCLPIDRIFCQEKLSEKSPKDLSLQEGARLPHTIEHDLIRRDESIFPHRHEYDAKDEERRRKLLFESYVEKLTLLQSPKKITDTYDALREDLSSGRIKLSQGEQKILFSRLIHRINLIDTTPLIRGSLTVALTGLAHEMRDILPSLRYTVLDKLKSFQSKSNLSTQEEDILVSWIEALITLDAPPSSLQERDREVSLLLSLSPLRSSSETMKDIMIQALDAYQDKELSYETNKKINIFLSSFVKNERNSIIKDGATRVLRRNQKAISRSHLLSSTAQAS